MLENTFVLLKGIGASRETMLWRSGIHTWKDFVSAEEVKGIADTRKESMNLTLIEAQARLKERDSRYFASNLPSKELWRGLSDFSGNTIYLDIETTGLSLMSPVTVVGIYDGKRMHTLVKGQNLSGSSLNAIMGSADMIVTFNGACFDLPVLRARFPGAIPDVPHVDLRNVLRKLGLRGGLKAIERQLGIERDQRVEYMTGSEAVYLWRLWERQGKRNALDLLIEYNSADCVNLKSLSEYAYGKLRHATFERIALMEDRSSD